MQMNNNCGLSPYLKRGKKKKEFKMVIQNNGNIVYASKAKKGQYYSSVKGVIVKVLRNGKRGGIILQSTETGSELLVKDEYLLKEINQGEVEKEMAKNETNGKNGKIKKERKHKRGIEWEKISHLFSSGEPLKVGDVLAKVKVETTYVNPISRVYSTLRNMIRAGVLKRGVEKATFQLVGSSKKYVKAEKTKPATKNTPKKEQKKSKEKTKVKAKTAPKKEEKKAEPETPKTEPAADVSTL